MLFHVVSNFSQVLQSQASSLFIFVLESQHICSETIHHMYHKPHKDTRSKIFEGESFLGLSQSFLFRAFCVKSSGTGEVAESFFGFMFLITLNLGLVM